MEPNKQGKMVNKQEYTKVAAVAVIRLLEDIDKENPVVDLANPDEKAEHFKRAYLLISNRYDSTEEATNAYAKRWKIEVFYRNAKQELWLTSYHSKYKEAHESHIEMIFMAETMLCYANWELNKDGVITLTHGGMVREIINASHRISKRNSLHVYFDTAVVRYTQAFLRNFDLNFII
ncbi:hypothetical protein DE167_004958 [Clostridium beijerinckii]|uniref:Transposase IS4-like domain-containing protein n=2 Tax=Clostridium beijerinckii TaxID=1520 RepID=A0AAX0B0R1_CLOBE|nr:hypothetical protein [Clostridium beijerinckii]NYC74392.1 hypothetical protein [Clostridium beijerinckii]